MAVDDHSDLFASQAEDLALMDDGMWTTKELEEVIITTARNLPQQVGKTQPPNQPLAAGDAGWHFPHLTDNTASNLRQLWLAQAHISHFSRTGQMSDVDGAIDACHLVLSASFADGNTTALADGLLGVAYYLRFQHRGIIADLDCSLDLLQKGVKYYHPRGVDTPYLEAHLGASLIARFESTGSKDDLDKAIEFLTHAEAESLKCQRHRNLCLAKLGYGLCWLYVKEGGVDKLGRANTYLKTALCDQPPGHRDRYMTLLQLYVACALSEERDGSTEQLDRCLEYTQEALELCPSGHPDRPEALRKRAAAIYARYTKTACPSDRSDIIRLGREAVALCPKDHPRRDRVLASLASHLAMTTPDIDNVDFIDEIIHLQAECLSLRPCGHPERGAALVSLANRLSIRYMRLGHEEDLSQVVAMCEESLELQPRGSRGHGLAVFCLSDALANRFQATNCVGDMYRAIRVATEWLDDSECSVHFSRADALSQLGTIHVKFYLHNNDVSCLTTAIELYLAADAAYILEDRTYKKNLSYNWCTALGLKAVHTRNLEDVNQTMDFYSAASSLLDPYSSEFLMLSINAARLHALPGTPYCDPDLALDLVEHAVKKMHVHPRIVFEPLLITLTAVEDVLEKSDKPQASWRHKLHEIYEDVSTKYLPLLAHSSLEGRSRLRVLREADNIGDRAAIQALLCKKAEKAVQLLEETHAIFWARYLRTRTALDPLPMELKNKLTQVMRRIEQVNLNDLSDKVSLQRSLWNEFDSIVQTVRNEPGFERFLMPSTYQTISEVARFGPVVILIHDSLRAFGLIITAPLSNPQVVELPGVNAPALHKHMRSLPRGGSLVRAMTSMRGMRVKPRNADKSEDVLAELWSTVMQPIINATFIKAGPPSLWLCATGLFSHLPLHASGIYVHDGLDNVSNHFVTSYTPTLGSLLRARSKPSFFNSFQAKVLIAAAPNPPNFSRLPYAFDEVSCVLSAIPREQIIQRGEKEGVVVHERAKEVLEAVDNATMLHLACHGFQSSDDPLTSGFVMQDQVLTVSRLMKLDLPKAFFAFLSACDSARSDVKQPNQAVTLASTMLFVGFTSVIGTMWSMNDIDGPALAAKIYSELFKEGATVLDPNVIPYALDDAVQSMRRQGLHMSRWATYTHLGI